MKIPRGGRIEVAINEETGLFEVHIDGIKGSECEVTQAEIEQVTGSPDQQRKTAEWHERARLAPLAQQKVTGR